MLYTGGEKQREVRTSQVKSVAVGKTCLAGGDTGLAEAWRSFTEEVAEKPQCCAG